MTGGGLDKQGRCTWIPFSCIGDALHVQIGDALHEVPIHDDSSTWVGGVEMAGAESFVADEAEMKISLKVDYSFTAFTALCLGKLLWRPDFERSIITLFAEVVC